MAQAIGLRGALRATAIAGSKAEETMLSQDFSRYSTGEGIGLWHVAGEIGEAGAVACLSCETSRVLHLDANLSRSTACG